MFRKLLEYLGDACILAFAVFSLFLLTKIAIQGELRLIEPNPVILAGEMITALAIFVLFVERFVDDLMGEEHAPALTGDRWKKLWEFIKEKLSGISFN